MNNFNNISAVIEGKTINLKMTEDTERVIHELNKNQAKQIDRVTLLSAVTSLLSQVVKEPNKNGNMAIVDGDFNITMFLLVEPAANCFNITVLNIISNETVWCTVGTRSANINNLLSL